MSRFAATKSDGAPRIAVVTANANASNSYTLDWLDAFIESPLLKATHIDLYRPGASGRIRNALREVDATVLLHSATADDLQPLKNVADLFSERRGPVCVLVGNEINLPWAPMSQKIALMRHIGATMVGTQLLPEAGEYLYAALDAKVVSLPHAVDPRVLTVPSLPKSGHLRAGTRSARYLPILGDSDRERFLASAGVEAHRLGWQVDIGTRRFERAAWRSYLSSLDVAVGTEAGSWFTFPSDEIVQTILDDARAEVTGVTLRVDGPARTLSRRIPWQWRQWVRSRLPAGVVRSDLEVLANLDADTVIARYFSHVARPPVYTKAISSRHLEAAALGTPQLLLEGRYNGILHAGKDYVSVSTDLSNLTEGLCALADPKRRLEIAQNARSTVEDGNTLTHRIRSLLSVLLG